VPTAWHPWVAELAADGRAVCEQGRWFAAGAPRDAVGRWRGRLDAQLPIYLDELSFEDAEALRSLESEGLAMRARLQGREVFGHRRLLARIRRAMVERLRAAIEPVTQDSYERFLHQWQGLNSRAAAGPGGLSAVLTQMASASFSAEAWETEVLPQRLHDYQREQLDQRTLSGEFVWLRLWGSWRGPLGKAPLSIVPRSDLGHWLSLPWERPDVAALHGPGQVLLEILQRAGACFPTDLQSQSRLLQSQLEEGLAELVGLGLATCDSFAAMRQLAVPPSRRRFPLHSVGRWSLLPWPTEGRASEEAIEHAARSLLHRFGVVAHPRLVADRFAVPWRLLLRAYRSMELRGEVRGGRFVSGWSGEQFALPNAVAQLRSVHRDRVSVPTA
jgi:ATP-dependent Lhr-like helicase